MQQCRAYGDREDIEGHPFVGHAKRVLDRGHEQAGIARADAYITNVVKHFRYKARSKRRIHQRPDRCQLAACLPWLEPETEVIVSDLSAVARWLSAR